MKGVHALVVLGAGWDSEPLVCDFMAVSKTFIDHGLEPTCLSSFDLSTCVQLNGGKLKFGRDNIPGRTRLEYTLDEAVSMSKRFYTIVPELELKRAVVRWLTTLRANLKNGDRVIIFFSAHEMSNGNICLGRADQGRLTSLELKGLVGNLPMNCRVLLMANSCWSGQLTFSAKPDVAEGTDLLIHAASLPNEKSKNFRTASDKYRCGVWTAAVIHEMVADSEGDISQYLKRVEYECENVDMVWQSTRTTPTAEFSKDWLRMYCQLSYWKPSQEVATQGPRQGISSESWWASWAGARRLWQSRPSPPSHAVPTNAQQLQLRQAYNAMEEEDDRKLDGIRNMLQDVICEKASAELNELVINTVCWIDETQLLYQMFLEQLIRSNTLCETTISLACEARKALTKSSDHAQDGNDSKIYSQTCEKISKFFGEFSVGFYRLQTPISDRCVPIFFVRFAEELVHIIAWHALQYRWFDYRLLVKPLDEFLVAEADRKSRISRRIQRIIKNDWLTKKIFG